MRSLNYCNSMYLSTDDTDDFSEILHPKGLTKLTKFKELNKENSKSKYKENYQNKNHKQQREQKRNAGE